MTYKLNFEIKKVKTSLQYMKIIRQRLVNIGTLNMKVCSGHPRASSIKNGHWLKLTVFKGIIKLLLRTANIQNSEKKLIF